MTVDVETERLLIGTTVGGDTASLSDLERWIGNSVQPLVDDVGQKINDVIGRVPEVWNDDWASENFIDMLKLGRDDTYELADRLGKVAELIGGTVPAINTAHSNLQDVADDARSKQFDVNEDGIWYPEDPGQWEYNGNPASMWRGLENQANDAVSPLASQMETMANNSIWTSALFASGSIVSQTTDDLLDRYESERGLSLAPSSHGPTVPLLGTLEPGKIGILKLAAKVGGPVIDGLQAGIGLSRGKRADQVFVEFGVSATLGSGAAWTAGTAAAYLVAGSWVLGPLFGAAAVGMIALTAWASSEAGQWWIRNAPMSSRSRLAQSGGEGRYYEDNTVEMKEKHWPMGAP